jgi:tetratricopeptide (TPR) repeat protein
MKRLFSALILFVLTVAPFTRAQVQQLAFTAGTDEEKASQIIDNESDAAKKTALLNDFLVKFAGNPVAVAYGNFQLAQLADAAGKTQDAAALYEKAVAALPNGLDLLVSTVNAEQKIQNGAKLVHYAAQGGSVFESIAKMPKGDLSDADYADQIARQKSQWQSTHDYLETAAINAIQNESDAQTRLKEIDEFNAGFPHTRFADQISQLTIYGYQETKQWDKLAEFGEKAVASKPDDLGTLALLAAGLSEEEPGRAHLLKAIGYAKQAIKVGETRPSNEESDKLSLGLAHSALGYALMKQEKTQAAVVEFKAAEPLLASNPNASAMVMYRLGYAYAKLAQYEAARATLLKVVDMDTPMQGPARELLTKISTPKKRH